VGEASPLIKHQ